MGLADGGTRLVPPPDEGVRLVSGGCTVVVGAVAICDDDGADGRLDETSANSSWDVVGAMVVVVDASTRVRARVGFWLGSRRKGTLACTHVKSQSKVLPIDLAYKQDRWLHFIYL